MPIKTYDDLVNAAMTGVWNAPIDGEQVNVITLLNSSDGLLKSRVANIEAFPSLPSGISNFIATSLWLNSSAVSLGYLIAKGTNLGSIDISGASGTFTPGSAMPNASILGSSSVLMEVTTVLNATPGTLSFTYVNQDGTGGQTSGTQTLTANSAVGSVGIATLNTADWGLRSISAAARAAGTTPTGVIKFWGLTPLLMFTPTLGAAQNGSLENLLTHAFNIQRFTAGDTLLIISLNTASTVYRAMGQLSYIGEPT